LQFGFKIDDTIAPTLNRLKIYAFDNTTIDGYRKSQIINIKKTNNKYSIEKTPIINGAFGLGIFTYDKLNGSNNKNGVYSIKLYIDSIICYEFKVDELDFSTSRYINAHIDYCEKKESRNKYHRCYKLPHNKLTNYSRLINNGIIAFNDNAIHSINLLVNDIAGNTSTLSFKVQATNKPAALIDPFPLDSTSIAFRLSNPNIFKTNNMELYIAYKAKKMVTSIPTILVYVNNVERDATHWYVPDKSITGSNPTQVGEFLTSIWKL
jgi:hypothetical protein